MDCSLEAGEHFRCLICLDLLFKPVVQSCGHVFCFWCVHHAMDSKRQSRCPVCRLPYIHFPRVCEQLHHLLAKTLPEQYSARAKETEDMEQNWQVFSPRIPELQHNYPSPHKVQSLLSPREENMDSKDSIDVSVECNSIEVKKTMLDVSLVGRDEETNEKLCNYCKEFDEVSIQDLSCTLCKHLLYRPVVLNCGEVFCEICVTRNSKVLSSFIQCPSCQRRHPGASLRVCLQLHHYLEAVFPVEYRLRMEDILKMQASNSEGSNADIMEDTRLQHVESEQVHDSEECPLDVVHHKVGCDCCGMFPIVGDRYRCRDCQEKVGFDLCGLCHKQAITTNGTCARMKVNGRFNQQHASDHQMELVKASPNGSFHGAEQSGARTFVFNLSFNTLVQRRPLLQQHRMLSDLDDYIDAVL